MIYYSPYQLQAAQPLNARTPATTVQGALLRHEDGVGCLQPWPSLGDAPLQHHLAKLQQGEITPLVARSLACARWDGAARRDGLSLFDAHLIPFSHATLTQFPTAEDCAHLGEEGFTHLKIKVQGTDPDWRSKLESLLGKGFQVRLDFNHSLAMMPALNPEVCAMLDFIEDPFPYDATTWGQAETQLGVALALDRFDSPIAEEPQAAPCRVVIWKPACQERVSAAPRKIITTNMDHAIGQMYAAAVAAHEGSREICGLLTHRLFNPDDFFAQIESFGPALQAPSGTGLGFDDLIETLPWQRLL